MGHTTFRRRNSGRQRPAGILYRSIPPVMAAAVGGSEHRHALRGRIPHRPQQRPRRTLRDPLLPGHAALRRRELRRSAEQRLPDAEPHAAAAGTRIAQLLQQFSPPLLFRPDVSGIALRGADPAALCAGRGAAAAHPARRPAFPAHAARSGRRAVRRDPAALFRRFHPLGGRREIRRPRAAGRSGDNERFGIPIFRREYALFAHRMGSDFLFADLFCRRCPAGYPYAENQTA